ncbi:MAG: O-antigen ligase family protein [Puniceicoccales bacterium]
MPSSTSRHRRRLSRGRIREERLSYRFGLLYQNRLRLLLLPTFIFLVILAGGGMPLWAQALVLIVGGITAIKAPPHSSPGRGFDWAVLALVLASCLAFLPESWLGMPAWREGAHNLGIELARTVAPSPYRVGEGLLLLIGGILWFYLIWQWKPQADECGRALWYITSVVALMALAVSIGTYYGIKYPLGSSARVFTFFENRNQMATVLAMGGILSFAMAMQSMRKGRMKGVWHLFCTLLIFVGLVFCQSRAGVLLFCLGCALWFVVRLRVSRVNMMFKVGAPIFLLCISLLVIFGKSTLERFSLWEKNDTGGIAEMRVGVYQDASKMAIEQPVAGVGLGNFPGVFPQYRDKAKVFQSIIHPESDWVWVMTETGFTGLAALLAVLVFLVLRLFPFGEDRTAPLRAAAAIAFVIFVLHSLFDVPGHRLGTFMMGAIMYRLAAPMRAPRGKGPLLGRWLWRVIGLVCLAGGLFWLAAWLLGLPVHSRIVKRQAMARVADEVELRTRDAEAILGVLDRAIDFDPMGWWYYSSRATTRLNLQRDSKGALADFRRARFLDKTSSEVSFYEGKVWLNYDNRNAMAAWRDALNREDPNRQDLFRKMLEAAHTSPRFQPSLAMLTRFDDDFRYAYLMQANDRDFQREIPNDVLISPKLENFTPAQRQELLEKWALRGDRVAFLEYLDANPGIVPEEWYYRAVAEAGEGHYETAVADFAPHLTPPKVVRSRQYIGVSMEENERVYNSSPGDIVRGMILLDMQGRAGNDRGAIRTANLMLKQRHVPAGVYYWKGEALRQQGEYKQAWEAWSTYWKLSAREADKQLEPEEAQ